MILLFLLDRKIAKKTDRKTREESQGTITNQDTDNHKQIKTKNTQTEISNPN